MSAALQLPMIWGTAGTLAEWAGRRRERNQRTGGAAERDPVQEPDAKVTSSLAFYRKHTERLLRRYLYASMQVGRTPSILGEPIGRGWVSSRPIRTFEDAVIFVLDVERCIEKLGAIDRQMLSRIVLQEYTQVETAALLGISVRTIAYKFPQALDRLTERLLEAGLLILPHS
jgi:Sigma-70, region 4